MIWSFLRNFYFGENWGFAESVIVQLIVVVFVIFFLHADKYILSVKISAQTSSTPKNFRHWLTHFPCQN